MHRTLLFFILCLLISSWCWAENIELHIKKTAGEYANHEQSYYIDKNGNEVEHGDYKRYDSKSGILEHYSQSVHGKLNGKMLLYYRDGILEEERHYKDDKLHGKRTYYYNDGTINSERNYNNGLLLDEKEKPFTGELTIITSDGLTKIEMFNGGVMTQEQFVRGNLKVVTIYEKNKEIKKQYFRDGKLFNEVDLIKGESH